MYPARVVKTSSQPHTMNRIPYLFVNLILGKTFIFVFK